MLQGHDPLITGKQLKREADWARKLIHAAPIFTTLKHKRKGSFQKHKEIKKRISGEFKGRDDTAPVGSREMLDMAASQRQKPN